MEYTKADLNWLISKMECTSERYMEAEKMIIEIIDMPWWKRPAGFEDIENVKEFNRQLSRYIRDNNDPEASISEINLSVGRYLDESGDVYLNQADYEMIEKARANPSSRATTIYNSWYNPNYDGLVFVWYWDNGSWHYFAGLQQSEAFLTCPSNWDQCSDYNRYFIQGDYLYTSSCGSNCCRDVYGRFWTNTIIKDQDKWSFDVNYSDGADWWEARIRDSQYTGPCCFNVRQYVLNGDCSGGNTGAQCGFTE